MVDRKEVGKFSVKVGTKTYKVTFRRNYSEKYFSPKNRAFMECELVEFPDAARTDNKLYRKYLRESAKAAQPILAAIGAKLDIPASFKFSKYAGCSSCPCSPGFLATGNPTNGMYNLGIWIR